MQKAMAEKQTFADSRGECKFVYHKYILFWPLNFLLS